MLKHISGPLGAGHTNGFYQLLEIMETHGKPDTKRFSREIRKECPRNINCGALYMYMHSTYNYAAFNVQFQSM